MATFKSKNSSTRFDMYDSNSFANIMLDLECADARLPNPVLIQLGAVYFDLDTGEEFDHIDIAINFDSCLAAGLQLSRIGMRWLEKNIPLCLARSTKSEIMLKNAMQLFDIFVRKSIAHARSRQAAKNNKVDPQVMVWGNGSVADNIWIKSAYRACSMTRPWEHWNDMCVRTLVRQIEFITGEFFSGPRGLHRDGILHDALDDCRYQIKYLVAARQSIVEMKTTLAKSSSVMPILVTARRSIPKTQVRHGLQTPETSFSGTKEGDDQSPIPNTLDLHRFVPSETTSEIDIKPPGFIGAWNEAPATHGYDSIQLPTPNVSFSVLNADDEIEQHSTPESSSTNYGDIEESDFEALDAIINVIAPSVKKCGSEDDLVASKRIRSNSHAAI